MAVPNGYVWARDLDPNAKWDNKTKNLTVSGKTYNPGQYYLENGRAYLPSQVPRNMVPIRSWFENQGQTVSWDPNTRTASTSGGFNFAPGSYMLEGGKSYVDPVNLAGMYLNKPAKQLTQDTYNQYYKNAESVIKPQYDSKAAALKQSMDNNLRSAAASAIARGTYDSGTFDHNNEGLYAENNRLMGELQGSMASQAGNLAMQTYSQDQSAEQARINGIVNYLLKLDQMVYDRDRDQTSAAQVIADILKNG